MRSRRPRLPAVALLLLLRAGAGARGRVTSDGYELGHVTEALADFAKLEYSTIRDQLGQTDYAIVKDEIDPAKKLSDAVQRRRDDDVQMQKVLDWAKSNPGKILSGNLDYRPRNLGTVAKPESIFADQ